MISSAGARGSETRAPDRPWSPHRKRNNNIVAISSYFTMKFTFAITALIAASATAFAPNAGVVTSRAAVSSSSSSSALE
jgi:hypothetical protein